MQPILEVIDLSHSFGGLKALTDFSLEIFPGELVGLIGPNGAGKTTVFNLITGVFRISAGPDFLPGRKYQRLAQPPHHRRRDCPDLSEYPPVQGVERPGQRPPGRLRPTWLYTDGCPAAQPAFHGGRAAGNRPGLCNCWSALTSPTMPTPRPGTWLMGSSGGSRWPGP